MPLIEGEQIQRDKPIPFWQHPAPGQSTPAMELMSKLKKAQAQGEKATLPNFVRHPVSDDYPKAKKRAGDAAWLDGPWKLHRRPDGDFLLYNLEQDPKETNNVIDQHPERAQRMKQQLKTWQQSVHKSLKGADYDN